jgi:hypothetical protein
MATQNKMENCKSNIVEGAWDGVTAEEAEELWRQAQEDQKQPRRRYSFHHLQRALGILPPKDDAAPESMAARWTEEEYMQNCAPAELAEEQARVEEEPWCHYCHPTSGCDGDHGDECRDGIGPIYKGPRVPTSPLTVPAPAILAEPNDDLDNWAKEIQRLVAESKAIREAPNSAFVSASYLDDDTDYDKVNIEDI